ncbi:MAG: Arm DNA-binding domain-containing protein, partial [Pseudolabrys sp.]
MARGKIGRLNTSNLKSKEAGLIADGGNLYLKTEVNSGGHVSRSWIFRYQLPGGKVRDMGLGSLHDIGLAMARKLAVENRELKATGVDPIERR